MTTIHNIDELARLYPQASDRDDAFRMAENDGHVLELPNDDYARPVDVFLPLLGERRCIDCGQSLTHDRLRAAVARAQQGVWPDDYAILELIAAAEEVTR